MRRQLLNVPGLARRGLSFLLSATLGVLALTALAQPANDNFADAQPLSGGWGTVAGDNTGATAESGEPSHGGAVASSSIWFKWTAPKDGEISLDTINSDLYETVLGVYLGTNVASLIQIAGNDDVYPTTQYNVSGRYIFNQPWNGPSALRFNATAGTTYYFAVDGKMGLAGTISLSWAYNSSGTFRFASEDQDLVGMQATGLPLYQVSEWESFATENLSTVASYYNFDLMGALVTVTRVGGSSGRVFVDYETVDLTAVAGMDYMPAQGTLVFDDFEMTKTILIQIVPDFFLPQTNRDFAVLLSNPRRDPLESTDVSDPRVDNVWNASIVRILDTDIDPIVRNNWWSNDVTGMWEFGPTNDVFNFAKAHYVVPEDINGNTNTGGYTEVIIYLERSGRGQGNTVFWRVNNFLQNNDAVDDEENNYFPLYPQSDYATPTPTNAATPIGVNEDYNFGPQGSVSWAQNDFRPKAISFVINNDLLTEFNEDFRVFCYKEIDGNPVLVGTVNETCITILADDQDPPAGSVDQLYNADFSLDMAPPVTTIPPQMAHPGTDGIVSSVVVQPDGRTIIGGDFVSYNYVGRNSIARMNVDGTIDVTFDPGDGANDFITSVNLLADGSVFVAGGFSAFDGRERGRVALLDAYGSLVSDAQFDPGAGANGTVWAAVVQPDGKYIIAGEFTSYDRVPRPHIARLNADGTLDTTFDPGAGPDGNIWCVALQIDGRIVIGGEFKNVGFSARSGVARLNSDGTLDFSFRPGQGIPVGSVYALGLRPDGKIWIGGEFTKFDVYSLKRFCRLNANGSVDASFDPGTGADGTVYSIAMQPDGTAYVGGRFTKFNGTPRRGFTRLYQDGTVDTTFLDTAYNQFAGLHRQRFSDPVPAVFTSVVLPNGNVLIGGSFTQVGGGQANPMIRFDPDFPTATNNIYTEPKTRDGVRNRSNVARLIGGGTPGPGNIGFLYSSYSVNRSQGLLSVSLIRTNGSLGYMSANFSVAPGLAQGGVDYIYNSPPPIYLSAWMATRMQSDGFYLTNTWVMDRFDDLWNYYTYALVTVGIMNHDIRGNRDSVFQLANPLFADSFYLGAANIPLGGALGISRAPLTIIDDDHRPGVLSFSKPIYRANENGGSVEITVIRTNGSYGNVSVQYATTNDTAKAGLDYRTTIGSLSFGNGQTNKTFLIPILNNSQVQPVDRTFGVVLQTPAGGATLDASAAVVKIIDDDYPPGYITLSSGAYVTNQNSGQVLIQVDRSGGNKGTVTVQLSTANGTALAGTHYYATNTTLIWNNGDSSSRFLVIPLIRDNLIGPPTTFQVVLSNPTVATTNAPMVLAGAPTTASVTIIDDDSYGSLQFSSPTYSVNENGGYATITVIRTDGAAQNLTVNYTTTDGPYALSAGPLPNFVASSGTLTFGPGEISKSFYVPIIDDGLMDPPLADFYFGVSLSGITPPAATLGYQTNALVYIVDTQSYNQPAGSPDTMFVSDPGFNGDVYSLAMHPDGRILAGGQFTVVNNTGRSRIAQLNSDASLDETFLNGMSGANGPVRAVLIQTDGRILVGGSFTSVNGINRNRLARLAPSGILDTSFNPSFGTDNAVFALAESFTGTNRFLLLGGGFNKVNGLPRRGLARMNNDGSIDGSFNPALDIDGTVYAIVIYPTNTINAGKILIGGDFTSVNGNSRKGIARLNRDGTLDPTFEPGQGADDTVRALALQLDGRILVGGSFKSFNSVPHRHISRLNSDGSVDGSFNIGPGTDDTVNAIAVQKDNRIVVAGSFTKASGVSRSRITRLLPDGSVDPGINFGFGADSTIYSLLVQPNDGMLLLGGAFTHFNEQPLSRIARVFGGALSGAGAFSFTTAEFLAEETATNAVITIRRAGGTAGSVTVRFATSEGTALAGINYSNVSSTLFFPEGETFQSLRIPVQPDARITTDLKVNLTLSNPQIPSALGDQPVATLTIVNTDSAISFARATYSVPEDITRGLALIDVIRQGATGAVSSVTFFTSTNGTAWAGTNYVATTNTVTFQPGETNVQVALPILRNPIAQGDTTVVMMLTNASNALLFSPSIATLTILDVDRAPGQIMFSATNYVVSEVDSAVPITLVRTNGRTGNVSVRFQTMGGTAVPGVKFIATNGVIAFAEGESTKTVYVPILQENQIEGNQVFTVALSNPTGGAGILAPNSVPVTILDDDIGVYFSSPIFVAPENGGSISLTVLRVGTNEVTSVQYATTNATAVSGTNYQATTGTLVFTKGEAIKTFSVPLVHDPRVTGDQSFQVHLFNASAPAALATPSLATVVVLDSDPGVSFTNSVFYGVKSGTNVLITVVRSNANTGTIAVNYSTFTNLDDTAIAGLDYVATSGSLTFSNGIAFQTFTIPLVNNRIVNEDRTFSVLLFTNAYSGGVQILEPSVAQITVTNDVAGLSFSRPSYTVNENGVSALISVIRTGYTNSTVSVDYSTTDGTAKAYVNYFPASGSFTFTNGETVKNFSVGVVDNSTVEGDKSVLLNLSSPVGNAVLTSTNASVLTIVETSGSLIMPAGSALVTESGPGNGVIDTNETVTMLFALRNASGTNTANLTAQLIPTSAVMNPSGPQDFGVLTVHGPSVSRPFTFTARGTNGQVLSATLQLRDGTTAISNVVYNFVMGSAVTSYSNNAPIFIDDYTKARPYPSIINVGGVGTVVTRATVTLSNIYHSWPSDINMLLVSPTGGKSYLMSKAGGSYALSKTTLTFDDTATASLPFGTKISSSTNKPSAYAAAPPPFPIPAPPAPYPTNLAGLMGSNPNGDWSLFVYDDSPLNSGIISNGWSLSLITSALVPASADLGISMTVSPVPVVLTSNLTYVLSVTNHGPSSASGVTVTDYLPAGAVYVSSQADQGTVAANATGIVTWNVGSLAKDAYTHLTLVAAAQQSGAISNYAVVSGLSGDQNPDNNAASATDVVSTPSADLALDVVAAPTPLLLGQELTYSFTIRNLGPATAPNVILTNVLPFGVSLVAASPETWYLKGNVLTFTNLGTVGSGGQTTAAIVVHPDVPGTLSNVAVCRSGVLDPAKGNNVKETKAIVEPIRLRVAYTRNSMVLSWSTEAGNLVLERATNMAYPVIWMPAEGTQQTTQDGASMTLPIGTGTEFFRLRLQSP
jgi:uncharacterized delta-60 repeat protein/uncharacterized repeat protein (TIGR01451 family)